MAAEFAFEFKIAYFVAVGIEIEDAVEAGSFLGDDEIADMQILLQRAGSADSHDVQCAMFRFYLACLEIDVGEGVEFSHHNLDIIGTDAV